MKILKIGFLLTLLLLRIMALAARAPLQTGN